MIGYNVVQPNGIVRKQRVETEEARRSAVDELQNRWSDYCNKNWISSNHEDPFCCENRVKLFQDGLAYFLMLGNTGGIVTDYKRLVDGKREIPISSCPSYVEDIVYGTGSTIIPSSDDECIAFQSTLDRLDRKAEKYTSVKNNSKNKHQHSESRYDKMRRIRCIIGDAEYLYPSVDTDNRFELNGHLYQIDSVVSAYAAKDAGNGDVIYDMDKIMCAVKSDGQVYFFDMNLDMVQNQFIHDVG